MSNVIFLCPNEIDHSLFLDEDLFRFLKLLKYIIAIFSVSLLQISLLDTACSLRFYPLQNIIGHVSIYREILFKTQHSVYGQFSEKLLPLTLSLTTRTCNSGSYSFYQQC